MIMSNISKNMDQVFEDHMELQGCTLLQPQTSSNTDVPEKTPLVQRKIKNEAIKVKEFNETTNELGNDKRLLTFQEMPLYLQFNPHIRTGYRPMLTTGGSFRSLLYFHNETVNILTHGIPIVYILWTVPRHLPWDNSKFLPLCHILGIVCPWVGSFFYHLFMNHARGGEHLYYRLLQLDMLGIWVTQSFGALPMVSATVFCFPWTIRWLVLSSYCLLSIWGLYKALTALNPWQRRLCFALPFLLRVCLTCSRGTGAGGGEPSTFVNVFLQDAVSLLGGVIGAMHVPEKWFPGQFDYLFNSHNIMHVLVVTAVYFMHQATMDDLQWMSTIQCRPDPTPATTNYYMELR